MTLNALYAQPNATNLGTPTLKITAYEPTRSDTLSLGVDKRFSDGFQVQGSYTFSKSVDDASSGLGRSEFNNGQQRTSDPFDHKADRGPSSFEVRHNLK